MAEGTAGRIAVWEEAGSFDHLGWTEIVFVGSVALGLDFWQFLSINREIAEDKGSGLGW